MNACSAFLSWAMLDEPPSHSVAERPDFINACFIHALARLHDLNSHSVPDRPDSINACSIQPLAKFHEPNSHSVAERLDSMNACSIQSLARIVEPNPWPGFISPTPIPNAERPDLNDASFFSPLPSSLRLHELNAHSIARRPGFMNPNFFLTLHFIFSLHLSAFHHALQCISVRTRAPRMEAVHLVPLKL
eukprot:scaffold5557_cov21-Tisochrysis_lutea.AAC.3